MRAASNQELLGIMERFRVDPGVSTALATLPPKLRADICGNSTQYLLGYIAGVARSLQTLQEVDTSLQSGAAKKAAALRTMLSVTVLVSVEEVLHRSQEPGDTHAQQQTETTPP